MKSLRSIILKNFLTKVLNTSVFLVSCRYQIHHKQIIFHEVEIIIIVYAFQDIG